MFLRWKPYGIESLIFSTLSHALSRIGSYHNIRRAPVIPRIIKITNVSIPRNPRGLTKRVGKVNFNPMNIVLSNPE
jgi:hypothetical protein